MWTFDAIENLLHGKKNYFSKFEKYLEKNIILTNTLSKHSEEDGYNKLTIFISSVHYITTLFFLLAAAFLPFT